MESNFSKTVLYGIIDLGGGGTFPSFIFKMTKFRSKRGHLRIFRTVQPFTESRIWCCSGSAELGKKLIPPPFKILAHHSCKICGTSVVNFKVCTPPVGWARDAPDSVILKITLLLKSNINNLKLGQTLI